MEYLLLTLTYLIHRSELSYSYQGSNSASKTFTVTSSTVPAITLNPTSGPVGTPVNVTGTNFDPNSTVTITFGGDTVTTIRQLQLTAVEDFLLPLLYLESSDGSKPVVATQGSNSASKTFTVTSSLAQQV